MDKLNITVSTKEQERLATAVIKDLADVAEEITCETLEINQPENRQEVVISLGLDISEVADKIEQLKILVNELNNAKVVITMDEKKR